MMFTKLQTACSHRDVVTTCLYRPMHVVCSATPFLSTAALSHGEPPYAGTSSDSRSARGTTRGAVWMH